MKAIASFHHSSISFYICMHIKICLGNTHTHTHTYLYTHMRERDAWVRAIYLPKALQQTNKGKISPKVHDLANQTCTYVGRGYWLILL